MDSRGHHSRAVASSYGQYEAYDENPYEMGTLRSERSRRSDASGSGPDAPLLGQSPMTYYDVGSAHWALTGILWSLLWGLVLSAVGAVVWWKAGPDPSDTSGTIGEDRYADNSQGILIVDTVEVADWIPKLALNALVTLCNTATGNVHATTLKWALIDNKKPGFNANLRFFTAVGGLFGMNGYIANFLHAACLIISQAAVSVTLLPGPRPHQILIPSMPIIAIGSSLLIQTLLAFLSFARIKVHTWSSSPLDVAIAAKLSGKINRREFRCMRPAAHTKNADIVAIEPSLLQPNPWETHNRVKYIVLAIWAMVFASFLWSYVLFAVIASAYDTKHIHNGCLPHRFIPSPEEASPCSVLFNFNRWADVKGKLPNNLSIGLNLLLFIILQGILAAGLHCCELIIILSRDEDVWRKATRKGAKHVGNQVYNFLSWKSFTFLTFNPILHWILGNSLVIHENFTAMYPMQVRRAVFSFQPGINHPIRSYG